MTNNKKQPGPKGFILVDLVDRGNIVEIPLTNNKAWLTLFYALPEELVSKAKAYLENRDYVTGADVQAVFRDVCAHRVLVKENETGLTAEQVLEELLKKTETPDRHSRFQGMMKK